MRIVYVQHYRIKKYNKPELKSVLERNYWELKSVLERNYWELKFLYWKGITGN